MKLRPYQQQLINRIYYEAAKGHRRILLLSPTGSGKTVIAKHLIDSCISKGNRALFTVPRINLIEQTAKYFNDFSVLQGDDNRFNPEKLLQIAMIQTLSNREIPAPDLIIFDEIHYAYDGKLIQSIFERFPNAFYIGLSATPVDESGFLLDGFDAYIDDFQLNELINEKWLVPIECYSGLTLDLSNVRVVGGDYIESEAEQVVIKKPVLQSVFDNYIKFASGKKFICFAVSKKHGNDLTDLFNSNGIKTKFVHAETPMAEREKTYNEFKTGKIIGLVNIEILTAGYDEPSIDCCIMATPTKSWRKYIQAVGRVLRLNGQTYEESVLNGKSNAILLDCGNVLHEHGLPTERKRLLFRTKISRVVDRELGIDTDIEARKETKLSQEQVIFLKRIGSILDLYEGRVYTVEKDLQEDINYFLLKTGWFWWRQNSGKMFTDGRWVNFASKSGLPDNTLFFDYSSLFLGIELKLPNGKLTEHQKKTLPEMIQKGVLVYFAECVYDVWQIIKHVEENVNRTDDGVFISNKIYSLPERQLFFYQKFKLDRYIK
jgi:superfamily II DNA or RNA helicase